MTFPCEPKDTEVDKCGVSQCLLLQQRPNNECGRLDFTCARCQSQTQQIMNDDCSAHTLVSLGHKSHNNMEHPITAMHCDDSIMILLPR